MRHSIGRAPVHEPQAVLPAVLAVDEGEISGQQRPRVCRQREKKKKETPGLTCACGLVTVSSTLRTMHAASVAPSSAFTLTNAGSHTNRSILFATPSVAAAPSSLTSSSSTETPAQVSPRACNMRNLFRTSVASSPALSQMVRGITSSAFANAEMTSCCLPGNVRACARR